MGKKVSLAVDRRILAAGSDKAPKDASRTAVPTAMALPYDTTGGWLVRPRSFSNKALPRWEVYRTYVEVVGKEYPLDIIYSIRYRPSEKSEARQTAISLRDMLNNGAPLMPGFVGETPITLDQAKAILKGYSVALEMVDVARADTLRAVLSHMIRQRQFDGLSLVMTMVDDFATGNAHKYKVMTDPELSAAIRILRREVAAMHDIVAAVNAAGTFTSVEKSV